MWTWYLRFASYQLLMDPFCSWLVKVFSDKLKAQFARIVITLWNKKYSQKFRRPLCLCHWGGLPWWKRSWDVIGLFLNFCFWVSWFEGQNNSWHAWMLHLPLTYFKLAFRPGFWIWSVLTTLVDYLFIYFIYTLLFSLMGTQSSLQCSPAVSRANAASFWWWPPPASHRTRAAPVLVQVWGVNGGQWFLVHIMDFSLGPQQH